MSFHVILPSNSSMQYYPENKLADFRVKLAKPIIFDQPYLVALEEYIYPQVHTHFSSGEVYIDVLKMDDNLQLQLHKRIRLDISSEDHAETVIHYVNKMLHEYEWFVDVDEDNIITFYAPNKSSTLLRVPPKITKIFGFTDRDDVHFAFSETLKGKFPSLMFKKTDQMFVYADIVDYQRVGDTMAPLLRICVPMNVKSKLVSEKYIRPYYVPVSKDRIDEIHITIRNHSGLLYPFPTGAPVVVKLHFMQA